MASSPTLQRTRFSSLKLDTMVWPAELRFEAFGVRIGIRAASMELLDQVLPVLLPGRKPSSSVKVNRLYSLFTHSSETSPGATYFLYADKRKVAQAESLSTVIEGLESDSNFHIAEESSRWAFVHAGVIGWKGRAVVIPGASFSGKSSLVRELLAQGAAYYSDEFAAFDAAGRVHAFPRRLCLRDGQARQSLVTARELGARTGTRALPLGVLAAARYKSGGIWRPRLLSRGEAILELLRNSLSGRNRPGPTLAILSKAVSRGLFLRGTRGDAKETAASILETLERARLM